MQITQALALLIPLANVVSAIHCTEGRSLTKEEFAEYQNLNTTDGWPGLHVIPHCFVEESNSVEGDLSTLEARGGGNEWTAYNGPGCSGTVIQTFKNFGCGGCFTLSCLRSARLSREKLSGAFPTVDYFSEPGCTGGHRVHHQGIKSGDFDSCDNIDGALSAATFQGC